MLQSNEIMGNKAVGSLEYNINHFSGLLRKATLCFLVKPGEILLAEKKRGFAVGKLNGVGGKVNENEEVEEAMKRETKEEIGVLVEDYTEVAELDFYFEDHPNFNQRVFVYISTKWQNDPSESEEMRPEWFSARKIPFKRMWSDDVLWLPQTLAGKKLKASFLFDSKEQVREKFIKEVEKF